MAAKAFLALCASALLVQTICAHCVRGPTPATWSSYVSAPATSCSAASCDDIVASNSAFSNGGNLGVIVSSPIGPCGISLLSENYISGSLEASGNLPVLAFVALEGSLPSRGSAGTDYSCGNGQVGITSDSLVAAGLSGANAAAAGANAAAASAHGPIASALSGTCAVPTHRAPPCGCF